MPRVRCPRCSTVVEYADGFQPICPSCGFAGGPVPVASSAAVTAPATPPPLGAKPAPSQGIAIAALVLNVLIWPGLGTMVGSRIGEGLAQGFLFLLGLVLTITLLFALIGIPLMIGMWVWALVSGIQLIQASNVPAPAAQPA